jgi:hypothetical protein
MGGLRPHDRVPVHKRRTDEIAALLGRWPGMSFFAPPTMVKRLADDRAIAEADLSHLKTIIYGGAPMYLAAVVGRPDAKWGEAVVAFMVAGDRVAQPSVEDLDRTCPGQIATVQAAQGPTVRRCPADQQLRQGRQARTARPAPRRNGGRWVAVKAGPGRAAAELGENARCSRPQGRRPGPCDNPPFLGRRPGDGRGVLVHRSVGRARPRTHREETVR